MKKIRLGLNSIILVGVVVATLLAAGGYIYYKNSFVSQDDINKLVLDTRYIGDEQGFEAVEKHLLDFLEKKRLSADYRYQVTYLLAGTYINMKNFEAALEWYRKAEETDPQGLRYNTALGIAQTAEALGNNSLAIEYYKKTIELAKHDENGVHSTFIPSYEQIIRALENPDDPAAQQPNIPQEILNTLPR